MTDPSHPGNRVADDVAASRGRPQEPFLTDQIRRESENIFRTAFTYSPMGMVISGADGYWIEVNPAMCSMLGYERDDLVGIHFSELVFPADAHSRFGHLDEMLNDPASVTSFAQRYIHKDGHQVWAELNAALVRNPDGTPGVVILQIEDVTEAKKQAADRERLEGQLLQAQKMEAVGRLAGGIAHDFNNLLSVIINYSVFLEEDLPDDDPKKEDVREIRRAGDRATALVRQLLAFSRKEVAAASDVDLNEVLRDMDKLLRRASGEDVAIDFKLVPEAWPVLVDPSQVEQIIMNLVVNARDAMPKGGRLTLLTSNEIVTAERARTSPGLTPARYGCLTVADTGEGIPDEIRDHIFEPFFTTKPLGRGTGLGLSTVYGIVKQWQGYVSVYSEPGEGTAFQIFLPLATSETAVSVVPDEEGEDPAKATGSVLVVEDEDAVREMVERILSRQGYKVIAASSGPEALKLLELHGTEIDLLLTDVVMPQMSGKELVDTIAATGRELKTVFMSGYPDDLVSKSGILQSNEVFMQKPFSADVLLAKVRSVLQR
ncbi:MAG: two-component system, cell cycle sensor histidine kinase and response regulator CckA [Actinomycetota bacterium]|jgi:PAS domain S-box-containing protein|nr:two-component system, cell cycle sensor histidine kinase and response regulator CckA [Actinomycetota bacterium]